MKAGRSNGRRLWVAGLCLAGLVVRADASLIWSANFDSYSAGDNVTINTTGDDNTFRQLTSAGGFVGTPQAAVIAQPAGFTTSEAMALGASAITTGGNVLLRQHALGSYGPGSILVLSFDRQRPPTSPAINLTLDVVDSAAGRISGASMNLVDDGLLTTNRVRVTVVMNQSAGGIALPGSLGTLNANTLGMYFRKADGSYGATLATQAINADKTAAGFSIQQPAYTLASSAYFDNFGAWDSVGDTVGSTGVLELGFGAVIPEPTTLGLLGVGLALAMLRARRGRRS